MDMLVRVTHESTPWTTDSATNNFAIHVDGDPSAGQLVDLLSDVAQFYAGLAPTATAMVGSYLSSQLDRTLGASRLQAYDITGRLGINPATDRPYSIGSPFEDGAFTLPAAGTPAQLPSQVASKITFRGRGALDAAVEGPDGIRPRARKTGGIFIGPLGMNAAEQGTAANNDYARPDGTFINNCLIAAEYLQNQLESASAVLCVWSRANAAMYAVTSFEMDNSFDIQRRRKHAPTSRTSVTASPAPDLALGA